MLVFEKALYDVKKYIEDNFQTYVEDINSEVIDSLVIEDFKCVDVETRDILGKGLRYPSANLYIYDMDFTEDTAGQDLLKIYGEMLTSIKNNSESRLLNLRMMEAIRLLFTADTTAGGAVAWLKLTKMTPFTPSEGVSGCLVRFEMYIFLNR